MNLAANGVRPNERWETFVAHDVVDAVDARYRTVRSGDGRILITAAKNYGAHGIGIDIDPERVREATANARSNGVADKVSFRQEDLFTADISPATAVTLYLSPTVNSRLAGKLMKDLKGG